jgi:molybdopterin-guanine dinucleotide biosynthesis protein A
MSEEALTIKEFVIQWGQKGMYDKKLAADLNALLREELIKFDKWCETLSTKYYKYSANDLVDEYLKSQQ